ncbi:MAG: transposase [Phenylobacterium sp.]
MILARRLKLSVSTEQYTTLFNTLLQYREAVNLPLSYGFQNKKVSGSELHKETYYAIRNSTELPAQLVCSARCKATEILKSIRTKTKGKFNTKLPTSRKYPTIRFDRNSCTITDKTVKFTTIKGRIEIPIISYPFIKSIQWSKVQKTCELMYKDSTKEWYLIIFIEIPEQPLKETKNVLGVDRGCKNIAVCSNNTFFKSKHWNKTIRKFSYLRKRLQSKGTKSAKKLLKKLSGKEHRFRKDVNHCISKKIASMPFDTIIFEKLNIKRKREQGKRFNSILNSWSYYQLEQFTKYKAALIGKRIEYVDARYTSQKCSCCGYIERNNRKTQSLFKCKKCNFTLNADLNASRNIKQNFLNNTVLGISSNSRVQSTTHTNRGCSTQVQAPLL